MNVPILNPKLSNSNIQEELEDTALRILRSGQYILGKEVEQFEENFANYFGVKHAVGVSSGTDALIASLIACDIGPGDEVICPSFTFFATAGAISRVGATPVFVDIRPKCFTVDPSSVKQAITKKTKAIIPVHLFGQSCDMDLLSGICSENNITLIEDAAQAIGCEYKRQFAGTFGQAGCFSFFPSKNLGGFGDAGLIITNDSDYAERLYQARNHGMTKQYEHAFVGGNFRIDALQAALLRVKLKHHMNLQFNRTENAALYFDRLINYHDSEIVLPTTCRGYHVYNQFTIRVKNNLRDSLKEFLSKQGITSAIYYPIPLHKQPCFNENTVLPVYLHETEKACEEVLSLPVAPEITTDQINFVCDKVDEWLSLL